MSAGLRSGTGRYALTRLGQAVGVLWAAYSASFLVLYLLPGDAISTIAAGGGDAAPPDPELLARVEQEYGLDRPLVVQYLDRLGHLVRGDFGRSFSTGREVRGMLAASLPSTLQLAAVALGLSIVAGVTVALLAAVTRWRWLRQLMLAVPTVGVAMPTFWVGLLLLQFLSFELGWFPAVGGHGWRALALPAVTLAIPTTALISQVLARSLDTVLREPFIEVARAHGLREVAVLLRHALRNASLGALTVAGVAVGNLLAGSVIVETVFSRTGVGRLTSQAVSVQDIPMMQGVVVLGVVCYVVTNLVVDLLYPVLDPRIVHGARGLT